MRMLIILSAAHRLKEANYDLYLISDTREMTHQHYLRNSMVQHATMETYILCMFSIQKWCTSCNSKNTGNIEVYMYALFFFYKTNVRLCNTDAILETVNTRCYLFLPGQFECNYCTAIMIE